ncbi:MAG TPA: hypothetical protein VN923_18600, partial [Thermoanaerobaculia bacterium]|nr:hypothetical protein [Thermoanaerobaculia bacterium]
NVELVVKVLDACAAYQRFWMFAAGLTNVDVTIVVEDRWSGRIERYHRAGGALFAPLADTSRLDVCAATKPMCGHGNRADILASPRADIDAEGLALLLGDGVAAEDAIYQRLHADLDAIRAANPALADNRFGIPWWLPHELSITGLTPLAHVEVRAGTYTEWNCLNAWYRGELPPDGSLDYPALRFAPVLHNGRIADEYEALPGIVSVQRPIYGEPSSAPGMCAISYDGFAYDYFIEDGAPHEREGETALSYALPMHFYRVAAAGAAPVLVGIWGKEQPPPAWKARADECYRRLAMRAGVTLPGG